MNSQMGELTLKEWNRHLVDAFFPAGSPRRSRLFLTDDKLITLAESTKRTKEEVISSLYHVTSAQDISEDLWKKIRLYGISLEMYLEELLNEHEGKNLDMEEIEDLLIDKQVNDVPPFLAHLVVIVHAYMSGDRGEVDPNDVYRTTTNSIAQVLNLDANSKNICHQRLRNTWPVVTREIKYVIGTGTERREFGSYSPWGILKRWTELRADTIVSAVTLDTCEVIHEPYGFVRPIQYHAPFLSDDREVLERIGRELRRISNIKPSEWSMFQQVERHYHNLSRRARNTLDTAFKEKDEGAASFVDIIDSGFEIGPLLDSNTDLKDSDRKDFVNTEKNQNAVSPEVVVYPDEHGDLIMSVLIVDHIESDEDFIISIDGQDVTIPVDNHDKFRSEPIDHYLNQKYTGVDLNVFHKYILRRGGRTLQFKKTSAFLRTLQARLGIWEEAKPSSGQKVLIISKEKWVKSYIKNESLKMTKNRTIQSIFKIDGDRIHGFEVLWPVQRAVSSAAVFKLKGGWKSRSGRNRYLTGAPPSVFYDGSQAPEAFNVIQTINLIGDEEKDEERLEFSRGGWTLKSLGTPCRVRIRVELEGVQKWTNEVQFVEISDRWRDFLRVKDEDKYDSCELILDEHSELKESDLWIYHLDRISEADKQAKNAKTRIDIDKLEPFWISFDDSQRLQSVLMESLDQPSQNGGEQQPKPDSLSTITPQTKPPHTIPYTHNVSHIRCLPCRLERHILRHPNDGCAWNAYGYVPFSHRLEVIEELKNKHRSRLI